MVTAQCPITVNAGEDIYLCAPPTPTQLNGSIGGDYLNFFWSPTTGMSGATTLTPTVSVSQTTSYVLSARAADYTQNLIDNGDFESGNSSFTSDYVYNPGNLVPEGVYDVLSNPSSAHPNFPPCNDHGGGGNMMAVNGAGTPNSDVWCQTVSVMPNSQYVFSAWVTSLVTSQPARLQFSINGNTIGPIFNAPGTTCLWQNFFAIWNSGPSTTATICIVNQNTVLSGNDFALDDILFAPTCTVTDTVKVQVITLSAVATPAVTIIPCDGTNITLNGTGSSVGTNITYQWDTPNGNIVSGENTLSVVVNMPGAYTLTVSYEQNGVICTKTATANVVASSNPLVVFIQPPLPLGCGSPSTTLMSTTSQPGFALYQWSTIDGNIVGSSTQKNCVVNQPGTYDLLVTNSITGCTATSSVLVTLANGAPTANATGGIVTCAQPTAALSGAGSSTGSNIMYTWSTPNGMILSGQGTLNAVAGAGGTYIFAVKNTTNGCISYDTIQVIANIVAPTVVIAPNGNLNCQINSITLSGQITPANLPFVWTTTNGGTISSGQTTLMPVAATAGNYIIAATNPSNGCTARDTATVTINTTPPTAVVVSPADSITCQSPSVILSGTGSSVGAKYRYNWTASPGGNIVSGNTTLAPTVNAAGTYTLVVTDTINACTAMASVLVVADNNVVQAVANVTDTLNCSVNSVVINATGSSTGANITYKWTTSDGSITGLTTTQSLTAVAPGTYTLRVTNLLTGCTATDIAVVISDTIAPNLAILPADTLNCIRVSTVLQGQNFSQPGNFVYAWTTVGGHFLTATDTLLTTVDSAGVYTLTATNLHNGCAASVFDMVILNDNSPHAVATSPGPLTCSLPIQALSVAGSFANGGANYTWSYTQGGNILSGTISGGIVIDAGADYTLTITDQISGCTSTATVTVLEQKTPPPADAGPNGLLTCVQPIAALLANNGQTAGLNFAWSTQNGNFTGNPATAQVNCDQDGIYYLKVTDPVTGCISRDSVEVLINKQLPALSVAPPATITCVLANVSLNASATGSNLSYAWTTTNGQIVSGDTTASLLVSTTGNYTLIVTDGVNGCTATGGGLVFQNTNAPVLQIAPANLITCAAPMQTLQGQNQSLPGNFSYNWTASNGGNILGGGSSLMPMVTAAGTYTLLTTNINNGCTATQVVNVTANTTPPTVLAGADDTLTCNVNTLTINGSGTGAGPLAYTWVASNGGQIVNGATTPTPSVDQAGTYTLTIIDAANGCSATDAMQVANDLNTPQANAGTAPLLTCTLTQTNLNATASAGSNFSYNWTATNGGNILLNPNTLTPLIDAPGTYQLAVTNAVNGCTTNSTVIVLENIVPPTAEAGPVATLTCATTQLTLAGSGTGNPVLGYSWQTGNGQITNGATTATPVINRPGTYNVTVTNPQNGCTATDNVLISIDTLAPSITAAAPQILTCTVLTVPVNGTVAQPATNFTITWTSANGHFTGGQNTLMPTVDKPGVYKLTLQNNVNGCTATTQTTVNQDIALPTAVAATTGQITCTNLTASLTGAGSSVGPNFTYAWTGGPITGATDSLTAKASAATSYTLQVTNTTNGCSATAATTTTSNTTLPVVVIAPPALLTCGQTTAVLNAGNSSNGPNFVPTWTTSGTGNFTAGQTTLLPTVNQPGMYNLSIQNTQNGCTASTQTTVTQNITAPGANAGPGVELNCNTAEAPLQGSSPASGNLQYNWNTTTGNIVTGSNTATPRIDAPGTYTVTVTNLVNSCTSTATTVVTEIGLPTFAPTLWQPNCLTPTGAIDFGPISGGAAPFHYSINGGQTFGTDADMEGIKPGNYTLLVSDKFGCTDSQEIEIQVPFLPTVTLASISALELGDSIVLQPMLNQPASKIVTWAWTPSTGLSCDDCPNPVAKPLKSGVYNLKITDINGCMATAKVQILINNQRHLYAPNAIAPASNGDNARFTIYGKGMVEIQNMRIFDRWGSQLFLAEHIQPNEQAVGWDGSDRGNLANPGVFIWQATILFLDGEVEVYSGDVTVIR